MKYAPKKVFILEKNEYVEITYEELKHWNRGHYIYHNLLGGNGDLDPLKESLKDMYKGDLQL